MVACGACPAPSSAACHYHRWLTSGKRRCCPNGCNCGTLVGVSSPPMIGFGLLFHHRHHHHHHCALCLCQATDRIESARINQNCLEPSTPLAPSAAASAAAPPTEVELHPSPGVINPTANHFDNCYRLKAASKL
ncbi:hypothetical protein TYRP_007246 [Tyrophagus putrescentiae]|nr:hypothetical protein TYRP_007246 [Tyrophagus putrescentiae]